LDIAYTVIGVVLVVVGFIMVNSAVNRLASRIPPIQIRVKPSAPRCFRPARYNQPMHHPRHPAFAAARAAAAAPAA